MLRLPLRQLTLLAAVTALLMPSTGALAAPSISDFHVVAETPGQLIVSVATTMDASHGDQICARARPVDASGEPVSGFASRPWPVRPGRRAEQAEGHSYLDIRLAWRPEASSDAVEVSLYECRPLGFLMRPDGEVFLSEIFPHAKNWIFIPDRVDASSFRTLTQSGRNLTFTASYDLLSSPPGTVWLTPSMLRDGERFTPAGSDPAEDVSAGENQVETASLGWIGGGTFSTDAVLLALQSFPGPQDLAFAVVPRIKHWADDVADSDLDGISDINEAALGTDPDSVDTDGDGLEDGWELEGYRWELYQWPDANLPFLGADPLRKDVFVQVDYLKQTADHEHRLPASSADKLKALYAGLDIDNPDGVTGLEVRLLDDDPIPYDGSLGGTCGMVDRFISYYPERTREIHHWAIAGHGEGGQSLDIPSRVIAFGTGEGRDVSGFMSPRDLFMSFALLTHELGHNLGLDHGGTVGQPNCKPNYPSLMNYAYDYRFNCSGLTLDDTQIQFSQVDEPDADESALPEVGLDPAEWNFVEGYDSGFLGCNFFDSVETMGGNLRVDWNQDGAYSPMPVSVDLTTPVGSCKGGDGIQTDMQAIDDAPIVASNLADSLDAPLDVPRCDEADSGNRYIPVVTLNGRLNSTTVCGIPTYDGIAQHPWLQPKSPVFPLRPGDRITEPNMLSMLEGALDTNDRIRTDLPVDFPPAELPPVQEKVEGPAPCLSPLPRRDAIRGDLDRAWWWLGGLAESDLRNPRLRKALQNKLEAVLHQIQADAFQGARRKLAEDILAKMDGCAASGAPDRDDWIVDCDAQELVAPDLREALEILGPLS